MHTPTFPRLIAALTIALSSCGGAPITAQADKAPYVLTVTPQPGETPVDLERRYSGKVVVYRPEGGFAVLTVARNSTTSLRAQAVTAQPNTGVFRSGAAVVGMNGGMSVWGGGGIGMWGGGGVGLWGGGQYAPVPQNTATWTQIRLQQGHALAPKLGAGVKVAVIDTGIDLAHPAFAGRLAPAGERWDFVGGDAVPQEEGDLGQAGFGHGTVVAGIVAQVAPGATLLPLRVLRPDGSGDVSSVVAAIDHAVQRGAQVINLSLGSTLRTSAVAAAITYAESKGVLIVSSTGNTGNTGVTYPAAEARNGSSVSVASVNATDQKSGFSTYGASVELVAPGETVYGPLPGNRLAAWSGTSMAAPMVSGAYALALGQTLAVPRSDLPKMVADKVSDVYNNSTNAGYKAGLGKGRLNLDEFLRSVVKF